MLSTDYNWNQQTKWLALLPSDYIHCMESQVHLGQSSCPLWWVTLLCVSMHKAIHLKLIYAIFTYQNNIGLIQHSNCFWQWPSMKFDSTSSDSLDIEMGFICVMTMVKIHIGQLCVTLASTESEYWKWQQCRLSICLWYILIANIPCNYVYIASFGYGRLS